MIEKVGIGLITCNREKMFSECIKSIPETDALIVINDGQPYENSVYGSKPMEIIQHAKNKGVGVSKNEAMDFLLKKNCTHIFISEDDIRIKDPKVLDLYIKASEKSGLYHLNYGYHGPNNKDKNGDPNPRKILPLDNDVSIALNRYVVGAFSYFRAQLLKEVGLYDKNYKNAWEHVDHTYEIIKAGYNPPFWWFPDLADSHNYIEDLDPELNKSVLRKNYLAFRLRFKIFSIYFKWKHGHKPWEIADASEDEVCRILDEIRIKYGKE